MLQELELKYNLHFNLSCVGVVAVKQKLQVDPTESCNMSVGVILRGQIPPAKDKT